MRQHLARRLRLVVPPYYYHFSQEEIVGYYEDVLHSVDIPIIIYNIPAFTGVSFTRGSNARLLAQIVGIKHRLANLLRSGKR